MIFHFVTNEKWYSKLHRKLMNEKSTHMGIELSVNQDCSVVFDCSKPEAGMYHPKYWFKKYDHVYSIAFTLDNFHNAQMLVDLIKLIGSKYDWSAYYYNWYCALRKYYLDKPIPTENPYSKVHDYLCTEIIVVVKDELAMSGIYIEDWDYAMVSPDMIYTMLKKLPGALHENKTS